MTRNEIWSSGKTRGERVRNPNMRKIWMERRGLIHFSAILRQCCVIACCGIACCALALRSGTALAQTAEIGGPYPVGMKQMEYVDPADRRHLAFALFYSAAAPDSSAAHYPIGFFTNLHLHVDAPDLA